MLKNKKHSINTSICANKYAAEEFKRTIMKQKQVIKINGEAPSLGAIFQVNIAETKHYISEISEISHA